MSFATTESLFAGGVPSAPSRQPNKLHKSRHRSRTMELAMEMNSVKNTISTGSASSSAPRSAVTTHWRTSGKVKELGTRSRSLASTSNTSLSTRESTTLSKSLMTSATIYDYFRRPAQSFLHPINTVEHYWALRATIAETRLHAQEVHRQELAAVSASHTESRSRELSELNSRYERELARIKYTVWTILVALGSLLAVVVYLLVRYVPPPAPSGRGSMHFTIPILSPFASVIEHETSAVNVPLVAILLLSAGISLFLWLRCCHTRR
ncbi:hypothetical protein C8T65DRAFT_250132 [Cerioporus squamosus]|nr:hypothetical protein C8T65DRAFT_250132 [Cerioporus squamosus]